jgi:excisionase family DNA binding protein
MQLGVVPAMKPGERVYGGAPVAATSTDRRQGPWMVAPLLCLNEVMAELRIGRTKARALVWTGELPVVRIGRAVRVRRLDLDTYIEANRCPRVVEAESAGPLIQRSHRPAARRSSTHTASVAH